MSHFFVFFSLTSGLTDHDVAVFTLSPVIKALHLDIIGGFRLEMSNHMPVLYTWEWKVRGRGGGGKKRETKVRNHFLDEPVLTQVAPNPV